MFTQEQIIELQKNKNVKKRSAKSITYEEKFKLWAIKKYCEEGYSPRMIFDEAGFDVSIIGTDRAHDALLRWRRKYSSSGEKGLANDYRGKSSERKKKPQFRTKDEEIEYLKTKIAYINAENDFLAKLRGLKRE